MFLPFFETVKKQAESVICGSIVYGKQNGF